MGRLLVLTSLAFGLASGTWSGSAKAASFDCARTTLVSEETICANPQLSAKDDELDRVYRDVRLRLEMRHGDVNALDTEERRWISLRSSCHDNVKCISLWYDQRLISLRIAINTLQAPEPADDNHRAGPPSAGSGNGGNNVNVNPGNGGNANVNVNPGKGGGNGNGGNGGGNGGRITARIGKSPDASTPNLPPPGDHPTTARLDTPPEPPRPQPAAPHPSQPTHQHEVTTGTAYAVTHDGRFVTNVHVVKECSAITVLLNGQHSTARVVARDTEDDVALLQTDLRPKAVATLRASVRLGEGIAVFGFPLNGILATSGNFTLGNITATSGLQDDARMLQISAPVQPGNSGGPLVDESGNVVGTVVAKLNAMKLATITDDMAQNVNFAIKTQIVAKFLDSQGVAYEKTDAVGTALQPADLAERASAIAAYIECQ